MAESSSKFIALDKTIDDYVQDSRAKTLGQKHDETLGFLENSLNRRKRQVPVRIYCKRQTKRWEYEPSSLRGLSLSVNGFERRQISGIEHYRRQRV